jgi:uncharacterized Ntn-hydrolase superfamily protein
MTYSIIARDNETGAFGGVSATGGLAVGGFVLHLDARVGAIATQGYSTNLFYGTEGLALLRQGQGAEAVCSSVVSADEGRDHRQLMVLDAAGQTAAWTGAGNLDAKGQILAQGFSIAGNWLAGNSVLEAMANTYHEAGGSFAERLLEALAAGFAEGGDSRGTMSAALKVVASDTPPIDLRIDYAEDPIAALKALFVRSLDPEYRAFLNRIPTLTDPGKA